MSDTDQAEDAIPTFSQARFIRFSMDLLASRMMKCLTLLLAFALVGGLVVRPHWIGLVAVVGFLGVVSPVWWRKERA